jgi:hypothetical protein
LEELTMLTLLTFLAGMLTYAVLEFLAVVVIVRYYPEKISTLQRLADRIARTFQKSDEDEEDARATEDYYEEEEEECDCPSCRADRGEYSEGEAEEEQPEAEYAIDQPVITVDDKEGSYGVVKGKVIDNPMDGGVAYYNIEVETPDGPNSILDVPEGYVTGDEEIIPEGAPVRIVVNRAEDGGLVNGVTFKATVIEGELVYTVEYPDDKGDVAQTQVTSDQIWKRETEPPQAAAPTEPQA